MSREPLGDTWNAIMQKPLALCKPNPNPGRSMLKIIDMKYISNRRDVFTHVFFKTLIYDDKVATSNAA
jgi:hypothetical protein